MTDAACFACLSPGQWAMVELQLLCEILSSVTAGGGSAIFAGNGNPAGVVTPTESAALYIDKDTGVIYQWYDSAWH